MRTKRNYYSILQVAPSASPEQIRRAYVTLVREGYPKKGAPEGVQAELIAALDEAYSVLRDPDSRRAYDETLPKDASFAVRSVWSRDRWAEPREWWTRQDLRRDFEREILGSTPWFPLVKQALTSVLLSLVAFVVLLILFDVDSDFVAWRSVLVSGLASGPLIWQIAHQPWVKREWLLLPLAYTVHLTLYAFISEGCTASGECHPTGIPLWLPTMMTFAADTTWFFIAQRYDY